MAPRSVRIAQQGLKRCLDCSTTSFINGQCREFKETADTCNVPISPQLMELFRYEPLFPPPDTLDLEALAKVCQCCGKDYRRPGDLAHHLQTQHGAFWASSQDLLLFLNALTLRHGCICKPQVRTKRSDRVCLPCRQIAMLFVRAQLEFWLPYEVKVGKCKTLLEPFVPASLLDLICRTLRSKDFHHL